MKGNKTSRTYSHRKKTTFQIELLCFFRNIEFSIGQLQAHFSMQFVWIYLKRLDN